MDCMIGLDLGTTNVKAALVNQEGEVLASAARGCTMRSPRPGWVEQEAEQVWQGVVECLGAVAGQAIAARVSGLCLSGAMHSLLPVDAQGAPLAAAMTWADQRAAEKVGVLRAQTDTHALYERTGCPLQALYHPAKLRWWVDEAPHIARQAALFTAIKDWVLFRLTGGWMTDHSLASATGLQDTRQLKWDDEALRLAGVGQERLPTLVSPTTLAGEITPEVARLTSLPTGLPVVIGASDGALANLGAGAASPGQTAITVGTSGAIRLVVSSPRFDRRERTWCYVLKEGRWLAGGAINNAGLAVQWVRERFFPDLQGEQGYRQLMQQAEQVAPGAEGVFLLPYFTGERNPHWDTQARALIFGLSFEHTRAHIARAVLEGVAFCLADVWEALSEAEESPSQVRLTGGITQSPVWAQVVADVLGVSLTAVETADASAVGAAMLGFHALHGLSLEQMAGRVQSGASYTPNPERHTFYRRRHRLFQELYRQLSAVGRERGS